MAAAQETASIEEIVVTAQNRAQSIQDVPIAITAYDEDFIRRTKLDDVKDVIDFTPGFSGKSKDSFVDQFAVRGISTNDFGVGGDPSIGIFKDGVYQGRTGAAITSFFDIERTEALRGPQGFLFGRNAISGAISVITNKPNPDKVEGTVHIGGGERGLIEGDAAVNLPLGSQWAVRAAGYFYRENGYVDNAFNLTDPDLLSARKYAGRLSLGYRGDRLSALFVVEYERRYQSGSIYRALPDDESLAFFGATMRGDGRDADSDLRTGDKDDGDILSFTAQLDWDLDWATLTSLTGVRTHDYSYAEDFDGSPLQINNYFQDQSGDYYSQEFRLVSNGEGPLNWFAGVSGYKENIDASFAQQGNEDLMCLAFLEVTCAEEYPGFTPRPEGLFETNDARGRYKGFAAFADVTYALTERFEINAGVRYTYDEKTFGLRINEVTSELGPFFVFGYITDGFVEETRNWDDVTPRFTARYKLTDDWSLWGSVTRGYKAGGFGTFSLDLPTPEQLGFTPEEIQACIDEELGIFCVINEDGTVPAGTTPSAFNPEKVWSYEAGAKGYLADRRVQLDVNAFYYRYRDLQITYFDDVLLNTLVENVGRVKGYGLEGTLRAQPTENWDFLAGASWIDTKVANVPDRICEACDGNRLNRQPKWVLSGLIAYHHPLGEGEVTLQGEARYQSRFFGSLDNERRISVAPYADVGFRVGYRSPAGWELAGYVDNAFNKLYYDGVNDNDLPIPDHVFGPSRPRTFGLDFIWYFGR
ncbi:MAG: TonB-dependent receptor [Pseudomonadota bacterium]